MRAPRKLQQGKRYRWIRPDREWLIQEYRLPPEGKGKSVEQIARELETSRWPVQEWIKAEGLKQSHKDRHAFLIGGPKNVAWKGGNRNYARGLLAKTRKPLCEWCGSKELVQMHHKDHDIRNNVPDNLMWLCGHCNVIEGRLWALVKSGLAWWEMADGQLLVTFLQVSPFVVLN